MKTFKIPILFSLLFFLSGSWLIYQVDQSMRKSEEEKRQLRLEKEVQASIGSFQRGLERFATLVSGIRSFVQISEQVPTDRELQQFIHTLVQDQNLHDSLIVSYLNADHIFQYSVSKNAIINNELNGVDLRTLRGEELPRAIDQLLEGENMQLFPPVNLVEGWVGIPLIFPVNKQGKAIGYFTPLINFETIINEVYRQEHAEEFVYRFCTEDRIYFDRVAVYDESSINHQRTDPESFQNFSLSEKDFLFQPFTSYGKTFLIGVAFKQGPKNDPYRSGLISSLLIILFLIPGVFLLAWKLQKDKTLLLEQKNKELNSLNEALQNFAYASSHDLKEPLRTIGSFSSLLQRKYVNQLDKEGKEYLDFIVKGVKKLNGLLKDLLTYSQVTHYQDIPKEKVDLNIILADVIENLQGSIQEKNALLQVEAFPTITANPQLISQLLQNLISNALKFNDKAQALIHIGQKEAKDQYIFFVKDNGIGIEMEYQGKVFEAFQRLKPNQYEGSGVGLAICKNIVAQHEGEFWLESDPGRGSTFFFSIPK